MTPLARGRRARPGRAVGRRPRAVGGPALRNMATVGGNLLVGAPYGDVGVALLALDAEVELGGRTIPLERLLDLVRPGEEIVRAVAFDDDPASVFVRWARRAANSPAVVSVAVSRGRVALGGVAPHPVARRAPRSDDPAGRPRPRSTRRPTRSPAAGTAAA